MLHILSAHHALCLSEPLPVCRALSLMRPWDCVPALFQRPTLKSFSHPHSLLPRSSPSTSRQPSCLRLSRRRRCSHPLQTFYQSSTPRSKSTTWLGYPLARSVQRSLKQLLCIMLPSVSFVTRHLTTATSLLPCSSFLTSQ